jgi:uncharacterized protein
VPPRDRFRKVFEVRPSPVQGRGAFATRLIPRGTRIIEYVGERITHEEADARYDDRSAPRHHTFLFTVDDRTVVDAAVGGNDARFVNHSCEPNCTINIERGRIFIDALREIPPGEELFYDYAFRREQGDESEAERLYACRCGSRRCRGTILSRRG